VDLPEPEFFQAIVEGRKPFDYRLNDRGFEVGDVLHLREFVPALDDAPDGAEHYTGRELRKQVTYILDDKLGPTMREGFVVMGLGIVHVGPDIEPQPWIPMGDPVDIKVIGKLLEELGESVSASARALIQGIDGADPSTGAVNRQRVQDELADVGATTNQVVERFRLDRDAMTERANRKFNFLTRWLQMIPEALRGRS
jgi:hypothetical protein